MSDFFFNQRKMVLSDTPSWLATSQIDFPSFLSFFAIFVPNKKAGENPLLKRLPLTSGFWSPVPPSWFPGKTFPGWGYRLF